MTQLCIWKFQTETEKTVLAYLNRSSKRLNFAIISDVLLTEHFSVVVDKVGDTGNMILFTYLNILEVCCEKSTEMYVTP
mgnify:FL=1